MPNPSPDGMEGCHSMPTSTATTVEKKNPKPWEEDSLNLVNNVDDV
jgi:hypothetical protein